MISPVEATHLYVSGWFSGSEAVTVTVELEPTFIVGGSATTDWITGLRLPAVLADSSDGWTQLSAV
jgi:hypothetical protein